MNVNDLLAALAMEASQRPYFLRLEVLDQSARMIKARLLISSDLFIQVYRNDRFNTTNLVLMFNGQRLYGRDQLSGSWHRHTTDAPDAHDTSVAGSRPVSLAEFLDEVEDVLAERGLP